MRAKNSLHYFKDIKEFTFLIYLSIPIDNVTQQARVGICNSLKSLLKTETKNIEMLHFLLYHTVYSFYLFLSLILTTQVNNLYYDFSHTIKQIPASFCLRFLKQQIFLSSCCFSFKIYYLVLIILKKTLNLNIHLFAMEFKRTYCS